VNEYADKKAVVTGGTHGMRLAMVQPLLGRGAEVRRGDRPVVQVR
jgi:NAD(P)-dependent dehydrogenase (short-subunit alcohol dehydrogenase family)